jgi:hypothetical protein
MASAMSSVTVAFWLKHSASAVSSLPAAMYRCAALSNLACLVRSELGAALQDLVSGALLPSSLSSAAAALWAAAAAAAWSAARSRPSG